MKSLFTIIIFSITFINIACAQISKNSENTYQLPASKKVVLNLPFARNIIIKTWDK